MKVRGAPAIAIVAVLSIAVEVASDTDQSYSTFTPEDVAKKIIGKLQFIDKSRPTAVNLHNAVADMITLLNGRVESPCSSSEIMEFYVSESEKMLQKDGEDNMALSAFGGDHISALANREGGLNVLTHCNAGQLATSLYGTALGVVRDLHKRGNLSRVYATETRPYNQGARITSLELLHDDIPVTLICDSAVSYLFSKKNIDAVVLGADCITSNGDTANKVGTYNIAVSAKEHGIPFFSAAPTSTVNLEYKSGNEIEIEERCIEEITHNSSGKRVVAEGVDVWNPAFDVTPAKYLSGIITEIGVVQRNKEGQFDMAAFLDRKN